jgi:phenylalanyl-tRNA synthetase beta chain
MKVLLSWLREFAPFEGDPVALADDMSDLGMAVESIDHVGQGLDGIVVARVVDLRPHPNADKIQLVDVDRGDGEVLQVCCGAFNMAVGDLVPLATLGTTMPNGLVIEKRKLRGEWSNGMLCSAAELGFGSDHSGIQILESSVELGADLKSALGIEADVLYDLEVNPNRPDAMSIAGVARDLAARRKLPFELPAPAISEGGGLVDELASVEIVDADLCGRFVVRVLRGIGLRPSSDRIANRLLALGMRPINNVVDISNYVMLELGQPNHTFDLAKVPNGALRVRWAREGEVITTLDGVARTMTAGDGVVADGSDTAISIAGVMGGVSTEIDASTTDVLLEMAWWQPMAIARSAKRLGLRSEASARFERGTDPAIIELAGQRFAELLLAEQGELVTGVIDAGGDLPDPAVVEVRPTRVNGLLGTDLTSDQIVGYLEPIGFTVDGDGGSGSVRVAVPSFRPDTSTETDIIEEIARHHGYGAIRRTFPSITRAGGLSPRQSERRLLRQVLVGLGIDEALPMPFLEPGELAPTGDRPPMVIITNPLAAEESALRASLQPGLLKVLSYNASHRNVGVRLFEIGRVFHASSDQVLPREPEHLAVVLSGADPRDAVGVWRVLVDALAIDDATIRQATVPGLHPSRAAEVLVGGSIVGSVGEIDPDVTTALGLPERVAWLEIDLDHLLALPHGRRSYRPVSRYPSSDLDLAFEVGEDVPAATVEATIRDAAGELLVALDLFDVFRGSTLPEGTRSLAYRLRLQASDRTLTDDEVASVRQQVIIAVERDTASRLRG